MSEASGPPGELSLSVIIVTWNSEPVIADCLRSLARELPPGNAEVIVIDNASHDGTRDVVRATAPDAVLIANQTNRGLAAANNQGMEAARGGHFLICNPDVVFHAGAVRAMTGVLDRHERAAWVVPRLVDHDGTPLTSAGDLPTLRDAFLGRQAARRRRPGSPAGFWWDGWAHDTERPIGRGHECAYMIEPEAVREIGPQDERYVLDWEGFDWTERFRRAHWEIWLAPDAEVMHLGGASLRQVPFRTIRSHHRGMYLYFADRHARAWRPLLATAFGLRAAAKMAATGLRLPLYSWAHRDRRGGGAPST
jgi:N-acetylglucosaminyl-diphospho-decaprenol L-rhamnosyltransferase